MGAKSSSRNGTPITLIAVHTNEGPNPAGDEGRDQSAEALARYMDGVDVSYHKVVDDDSVVNYVPDEVKCWALRNGNPRSLNVCMTGYAKMSRSEWLAHDRMLRQTAAVVRDWCNRHGIPKVRLSSAEVGADRSGVCGHVNWTEGKHDGTHTDPGPNFPWDVFMAYVNDGAVPTPAPIPAPPVATPSGSYSRGDKDPDAPSATGGPIWRIQDKLQRAYRSYAGSLSVDGIFGAQTEAAVREFQKRSNLVADGIVGPKTWKALGL